MIGKIILNKIYAHDIVLKNNYVKFPRIEEIGDDIVISVNEEDELRNFYIIYNDSYIWFMLQEKYNFFTNILTKQNVEYSLIKGDNVYGIVVKEMDSVRVFECVEDEVINSFDLNYNPTQLTYIAEFVLDTINDA